MSAGRLSRRRLLAGSIASAVASAAAASPQGWVKLRLAASVRQTLPLTQTVTFGAKTLVGCGGHPMDYRGPDALSTARRWLGITGGNSAGHWVIDGRNHLVPKSGTAAYGSRPPPFVVRPAAYVLTVAEYADGALTLPTGVATTVTIDVIPDAAHIREMTSAPPGMRIDATKTDFQLNKTLMAGIILLGDTIIMRDGAMNPRGEGWRISYPTNGWAQGPGPVVRPLPDGTTEPAIMVTSEHWDTTTRNVDGHRMWGGGGKIGPFRFDAPADYKFPFFFKHVIHSWDDNVGNTPDKVVGFTHSSYGWGLSFERCRIGAGLKLPWGKATAAIGIQLHHDYVVRECYFEWIGWAMNADYNGLIEKNVCTKRLSDFINFGKLNHSLRIRDNFDYGTASTYDGNVHPDFSQFDWGDSTPATSQPFGEFTRNILEHSTAVGGTKSSQGIFMNPVNAPSGARRVDAVITNNIMHGSYLRAGQLAMLDNATARFNVFLYANSASTDPKAQSQMAQVNCKGGDMSGNVSNAFGLSAATNAITTPNLVVARGDDTYRQFFNFPQAGDSSIRTRAQAIAAWTPIRDGPAMYPDGSGRYFGALFPADDAGVVAWNDGTPFDPRAKHTQAV